MIVEVFAFLVGLALGAGIVPFGRMLARAPIVELLFATLARKQNRSKRDTVRIELSPVVAEESVKVKVASV
jgi:hypothetical protein